MIPITKALIEAAQMLEAAIEKDRVSLPGQLEPNYRNPDMLQQWVNDKRTELINLCADPDTRQQLEAWIPSADDPKEIIPNIAKFIAMYAVPEAPEFTPDTFPVYIDPAHTIPSILAAYDDPWKQARDFYAISAECEAVEAGNDIPTTEAEAEQIEAGIGTAGHAAAALLQKLIDIQPEKDILRYPLEDIGFSRLFSDVHADDCKYNAKAKCWYYYDGKRWIPDPDGKQAEALAKTFYVELLQYCAQYLSYDIDLQSKWMKAILLLQKYNRRITLIKDAQSNSVINYDDLDKDKNLFNCQNGVYNLKTMTFTPGHDPAQLLSKVSNVIYDPTASSAEWDKFISEVMQGDTEKIEYIQKLFGYCLTGDTVQECLWFWYGEKSRNGKSTTAETFAYMMGNNEGYAAAVDPDTLAQKNDFDSGKPKPDLARLEGVRFLNVSEPPKNMLFNAALVKKLTGGNRLVVRDVYEKSHEYTPLYKIIIDTNYLPAINDDTLFLSNRVIVIPFERVFTEEEQDHTLKERLQTPQNISGLFNWCLEGLQKYRRDGLKKPQSIRDATDQYKDNSDKVNSFFAECMERLPGINTKGKDVYQRYKQWCFDCGYSPEGQQNFSGHCERKTYLQKAALLPGQHI